jgi:hypothetical protein
MALPLQNGSRALVQESAGHRSEGTEATIPALFKDDQGSGATAPAAQPGRPHGQPPFEPAGAVVASVGHATVGFPNMRDSEADRPLLTRQRMQPDEPDANPRVSHMVSQTPFLSFGSEDAPVHAPVHAYSGLRKPPGNSGALVHPMRTFRRGCDSFKHVANHTSVSSEILEGKWQLCVSCEHWGFCVLPKKCNVPVRQHWHQARPPCALACGRGAIRAFCSVYRSAECDRATVPAGWPHC